MGMNILVISDTNSAHGLAALHHISVSAGGLALKQEACKAHFVCVWDWFEGKEVLLYLE